MKVTLLSAALCLSLLASVSAYAADTAGDKVGDSAPAIEITHAGAQPSSKGPTANFVGGVRVDRLLASHDPASRISIGSVTFEPGARSPGTPIQQGPPGWRDASFVPCLGRRWGFYRPMMRGNTALMMQENRCARPGGIVP